MDETWGLKWKCAQIQSLAKQPGIGDHLESKLDRYFYECITSVYPSICEQPFYFYVLGLAWTILSRANGPTPRTWGLLHCSFGREKSQSCRFATLFPTRRECPWDRPICSGAQCQRYVKHICFHCVNSILKSVFQNLSPWPPSLELSSPSLFFLSFWSSFFYTPTKNKSSVLKVSFAYFFWIGKSLWLLSVWIAVLVFICLTFYLLQRCQA